jgi:hypothetical protein
LDVALRLAARRLWRGARVGGLFSRSPESTLFVVGAVVLLLLFIGIHNAWDAVLYIVRGRLRPEEGGQVPPTGTDA